MDTVNQVLHLINSEKGTIMMPGCCGSLNAAALTE